MKKIYFRCDNSKIIGLGHIFRCLTIAEELSKIGYECSFLTSKSPRQSFWKDNFFISEIITLPKYNFNLRYDQLRHENSPRFIAFEKKDIKNIFALKDQIQKDSIVVVDHYLLGQYWEIAARTIFKKIIVIDDLLNSPHNCDLLIDPNIRSRLDTERIKLKYKNIKMLTGKNFVIIRPGFKKARQRIINQLNIRKKIISCLVLFGGFGNNENIYNALSCLLRNRLSIKIHAVIERNNKKFTQLKNIADKNKNIKLYNFTKNIEQIMEKCDIAIGALGTNTWERCYLGIPALVMVNRYNQSRFLDNLVDQNIIFDLGKTITDKKIINGFNHFQLFKKNYLKTRERLMKKIDGKGNQRITKELIKFLS